MPKRLRGCPGGDAPVEDSTSTYESRHQPRPAPIAWGQGEEQGRPPHITPARVARSGRALATCSPPSQQGIALAAHALSLSGMPSGDAQICHAVGMPSGDALSRPRVATHASAGTSSSGSCKFRLLLLPARPSTPQHAPARPSTPQHARHRPACRRLLLRTRHVLKGKRP